MPRITHVEEKVVPPTVYGYRQDFNSVAPVFLFIIYITWNNWGISILILEMIRDHKVLVSVVSIFQYRSDIIH